MRRILTATLLTTALSSIALALAAAPAVAQPDQTYGMDQGDSGISLDYFSDQLAPYGYWLYSDRWGLVWQPGDVSYDFHPYLNDGRWIYTDEYGWYWQSTYPWGDIPFHYGRWVNDPDDGWLWIPGYVWSPGWVVWRSNGRYIGWMPMPPDEAFLGGQGDIGFGGLGVSYRFGMGQIGGMYGYSRWYGPQYNENLFASNWVFVGAGDIARPDFRTVVINNPAQVVNIIHQTRNITNYTVVNNYVVNKSVDVRVVERAAGHPIPAMRASVVIRHPNLVATIGVGQRVQMRMRVMAPRGNGIANSAPPPPPRVVAKLSTRVPPPKAGRQPAHLFNKAAVAAPEARAKFRGPVPPAEGAGPAGMRGPNGGPPGRQGPGEMNGPNTGPPPNGGPGGIGGPGGERMRGKRPNAGQPGEMGGPNGQPGGPTGPASERPHRERPNGTNGQNAGPSPDNGTPGATGPAGQPGGATGPTGERPRRERPNGMTGPNGGPSPDNGPPGASGPNSQPGGAAGPGGERPRRQPAPDQGAAPGANTPPPGGAGPGGPGGMTGPGSERPRPQRPGTSGPTGGPPGGPAATQPKQAPRVDQQGNPQPPKKKKEQPENPPQ
jgi:hypothetical protein